MKTAHIFEGLNDEQARAVGAVTGPLCILAGAGSGKTTTITRRIANQVATGAFAPGAILAVTFTDRAAGEMRERLQRLGADGVRARTFHAAALAQLRYFSSDTPPQILPSKGIALRQIANTLPKPYRFRPAADLATEIEWAKNRRIGVNAYPTSLGAHEPPIPVDLMASVYKRYEGGKRERNLIDFEDLLELTIQMFQRDSWVREQFAAKYRAFTVDEYQDVNLLQETLLRHWVGDGDNLCVVGDDYQSIYGFTGATADYLLEMPKRFVNTTVVRLETNYRSTPQVLEMANRLVPKLGGAEKVLQAVRPAGPEPALRRFGDPHAELRFIVERIQQLHDEGLALEDIAILYRANFRSEDHEEALAAAGIPYQVTDGAFLSRTSARQMLAALKRSRSTDVAAEVLKIARRAGYVDEPGDDLGAQELTRQNDLARLVRLAEEFDDGVRSATEFVADVEQRFAGAGQGRGVNLLTYHRAKGLEYEAVFLPRIEEGELPFKRARTDDAIAEERRLFYVGLTRAKTHLAATWVNDGRRKGSSFLAELMDRGRASRSGGKVVPPAETIAAEVGLEVAVSGGYSGTIVEVEEDRALIEMSGGSLLTIPFGEVVAAGDRKLPLGPPESDQDEALLEALKKWRRERAKADGVPAFVIFHDTTLDELARLRPHSVDQLDAVPGIGPAKLERYGPQVIEVVSSVHTHDG
ncbi:MAG: ATP-dependent DNA helicase UvrD2 [Actinomycetota bacterium]|nr:ATP-dependent DNA helicase UvrD2 [Actinomycetota bacterium]